MSDDHQKEPCRFRFKIKSGGLSFNYKATSSDPLGSHICEIHSEKGTSTGVEGYEQYQSVLQKLRNEEANAVAFHAGNLNRLFQIASDHDSDEPLDRFVADITETSKGTNATRPAAAETKRQVRRAAITREDIETYLGSRKSRTAEAVARAAPPRIAEFCLAALLDKTKGDAIIGDLNERFERDCGRYDAKRARRIYWARALRSVWPLICRAAIRAAKWSVVIDALRRRFF